MRWAACLVAVVLSLGSAAAAAAPLLGASCGNTTAAVLQFESWLGRKVDGIQAFTGQASWSDYDGSIPFAIGIWSGIDRPVWWSIPLIPTGATLDDAAAGTFDSHYTSAAQALAATRTGDPKIYIRVGWELNGNWFPWAAQGHEASYIAAYQHFVTAFRAVSSRFLFEWNVNIGGSWDPSTAYPGDSYVDIIGMDVYWNTAFDSSNPETAWQAKLTGSWGLNWHQTFAAAHGKPTAYSEWGVELDTASPYVAHIHQWFVDRGVAYQTYWNSNSSFTGALSADQYPTTGVTYRQLFGKPPGRGATSFGGF